MSVQEIMRKWLADNGYDGLVSPSMGCGCKLDDLMPCVSECIESCEAGHVVPCDGRDCEFGGPDEGCTWHIIAGRKP